MSEGDARRAPRYARCTARGPRAERVVAYGISGLLAVHFTVRDFYVGMVVALVILPVAVASLRRFKGAIPIFALSAASAVSGILLTYANDPTHRTDPHTMVKVSFLIFGIGITIATLLWARTVIGASRVALACGIGALLSLGVQSLDYANLWKFDVSVPVILIVMSLPVLARTVTRQVAALIILAGVSGFLDSRSLAATLLIAAALLMIRRKPGRSRVTSAWTVVLQIAVIGVAGFFALQAALLEGILGEEAQARTALQIQQSGNVLAGGRPELGADIALLMAHPGGFGTGTLPSYADIGLAQAGMSRLGYNPDNGYVYRYMFGSGFEVHSTAGDLWLLAGIAGMLFAVSLLIGVIAGLAHGIAHGSAISVAMFLGTRTVWDLFFSPLPSSFFTLSLCLALLLPEVRAMTKRVHVDDVTQDRLAATTRSGRSPAGAKASVGPPQT